MKEIVLTWGDQRVQSRTPVPKTVTDGGGEAAFGGRTTTFILDNDSEALVHATSHECELLELDPEA